MTVKITIFVFVVHSPFNYIIYKKKNRTAITPLYDTIGGSSKILFIFSELYKIFIFVLRNTWAMEAEIMAAGETFNCEIFKKKLW